MRLIPEAEPCRNFAIMNSIIIPCDPRDGREKFVLSNYAANGIGCLLIVDTETLEGERYDLPNDSGAWALQWLEERGELLVGTCDNYGSLHCFHMAERRFFPPLRLETETYLWNFALGGDGCVYAGTYPGCVLVRYDPEKRTLVNVGKVGDIPENQYSRHVYRNADGNVVTSAGYFKNEAWMYDVHREEFKRLGGDGDRVKGTGEDFICLENGDLLKFLDAYTLEPIGQPVYSGRSGEASAAPRDSIRRYLESLTPPQLPGLPLGTVGHKTASGRIIGVKGQEIYVVEDGRTEFHPIPAEAPATAIMTIAAADDVLWGSAENGQTIFRYVPRTGEFENTRCVANAGGEVYGLVPLDGKLFMSSYVGGDHIVYDPAKPWDQHGDVNPRLLASVAPKMVRPHAKSVLGPDGGIWTGWYANYGTYGGGVTRIDPADGEVSSWFDLIPGQAIEHIAAGRDALFIVTSGEASGMGARKDCFHLAKLNTQCRIVAKHRFAPEVNFRRVAVVGRRVYVTIEDMTADESRLMVFDENTLEELDAIPLGKADRRPTDLLLWEDKLLVFNKFEALLFSLPDCQLLECCPVPGAACTSTVDRQGNAYCAIQQKLYRIARGDEA